MREGVSEMAHNPLRHSQIRAIGVGIVSRKSGRIESSPGGARTPVPGPNRTPDGKDECEARLIVANPHDESDTERRDKFIAALDSIRDQYESARLNRLRLMKRSREAGLSCNEIGVVLGITEGSVRRAIARSGGLD